MTIARYMVVFLRRADSEAQFSTLGHGAGANLLVAPPALSTRLSPRSASASPPMENLRRGQDEARARTRIVCDLGSWRKRTSRSLF